MFRFVLAGQLLALALGRDPCMYLVLGLLAAFLPQNLRRGPGAFLVLALIAGLGLGGLRAYQEMPRVSGSRVAGLWRGNAYLRGPVFDAQLPGAGDLRLRGCAGKLPAPGSRIEGEGLLLPSPRGREFRFTRWWSDRYESRATRASRLGRLEGPARWLFPATSCYGRRTRPLARALLFGDRRSMPWKHRCRFRDAGLAHLLALSGLHVGLFLLLLRRVLGSFGMSPFRAETLLLFVLPGIPFVVGTGPSIVRALLMAGYFLAMRRRGGRGLPFEALAFAAVAELLWRPVSLFQPGFQLSYLATASLLAAFGERRPGRMEGRGRRMVGWVVEGLNASLLCTLASLPVLMMVFDRLALAGPLWNLAAAPLTAAALSCGWLALPFGATPAAGLTALPAEFFFNLLLDLADWGGDRWRLVLSGFETRPWTWIPWGLGLRLLFAGKPLRGVAWAMAASPILLASPGLSSLG